MGDRRHHVTVVGVGGGRPSMGWLGFLGDVAVALGDAVTQRRRRRYEHGVDIGAPPEIVWGMLKSRDMTFDGMLPMRVVSTVVPGQPALERLRIESGNSALQMTVRVVDERPGRAILYEVLAQGTDPMLLDGDDDYLGIVLDDFGGGTRLTLTRELTITSRLGRLTVPFALRSGADRYKRQAELLAASRASPARSGAA